MRAQPSSEPSSQEINLIGYTVEEATARVDKFLDQAALAGTPQVRLIHGHGTGALRRGLAEFLKTHPLVEHIQAEAEAGFTIALTIVGAQRLTVIRLRLDEITLPEARSSQEVAAKPRLRRPDCVLGLAQKCLGNLSRKP